MTQENLMDAVKEDLEDLFGDFKLTNSLGVERVVRRSLSRRWNV